MHGDADKYEKSTQLFSNIHNIYSIIFLLSSVWGGLHNPRESEVDEHIEKN